MKENELITITDEDGVESTFVILFTYENEARGTRYVFFHEEGNEEEVMYARYYDDGSLEYVEDEEEIAEVEEVFATFESDLEDK
ncbi:MAG: DUF1292 domain-containing protein [Bacilli bacterium]|jgi:uncharacterized protein YrzB (UPF0473 family)